MSNQEKSQSPKVIYHTLNSQPFMRQLLINKLETGLKDVQIEIDKELDKRHLDLLKNWKHLTKEQKMSMCYEVAEDEEGFQEGMRLANTKKETLKSNTKNQFSKLKRFF